MGCATSLVKYIVFLFNFIFVLGSIAFIVIGVLVKLGLDDAVKIFEKLKIDLTAAPILMIVIGSIVFVIAFFGCCGAIKENTCMLTTYAVILLALLIAQVAVGIYAFISLKDTNFNVGSVDKAIKEAIDEYSSGSKEAVDLFQSEFQCCGGQGPGDWSSQGIPPSCCENKPNSCPASEAFKQGCSNLIYDYLQKSLKIIGIVIITIGVVELVGAIVALCLSSSLRNYERRGHYA